MLAFARARSLSSLSFTHLGGGSTRPFGAPAGAVVRAVIVLGVVGLLSASMARAAGGGPVITSFTATEGVGNTWIFKGTVTDSNPGSCVVHFAGMPSISGKSVQCAADGSFFLTVTLQPGEYGTAGADAVDGTGVWSGWDYTEVMPY